MTARSSFPFFHKILIAFQEDLQSFNFQQFLNLLPLFVLCNFFLERSYRKNNHCAKRNSTLSGTFSAEQEITYSSNSTVRFQFHLHSVRNPLVHKKVRSEKKESAGLFTILVQFPAPFICKCVNLPPCSSPLSLTDNTFLYYLLFTQ